MRRQKFGAVRTTIDGLTFASKHEARRYRELALLARAGEIVDLECQPRYPIDVISPIGEVIRCGVYTADFRYRDGQTGRIVVEDAKSGPTRTTAYRLRKRLVEALHMITVEEV